MLAYDLAAFDQTAADGTLLPVSRFPCSGAQERFWILEQLAEHDPALNVVMRWRIEGDLKPDEIAAAWRMLVARHGSLRTSFADEGGTPVQIVAATAPFSMPVIDLSALDEAARTAELEALSDLEAARPFDLRTAPLLRAIYVRLTSRLGVLLVTGHHIICDGWSLGVLARELGTICAALRRGEPPQLPALPVSYGEFVSWQREWLAGDGLAAEDAAVRAQFADAPYFEVPADHPRPPVRTSNGATRSVLIERRTTDALEGIARDRGCTAFMAALAGLLVLLHRQTAADDITLGTQVAGRDEDELEHMVGLFINTVLLRGDLSGDPRFVDLLDRVRDMVTDTFEMRHVPFERVVELVNPQRDPSRSPLFSVNFVFQKAFIKRAVYDRFLLEGMPSRSGGVMCDLNFFMVERPEGWRASCEFNTDLFEPATVDALLERFALLLRGIVDDPTQPISALPLLTPHERDALIHDENATAAAYPAHTTVLALVREQALRTPHAVAVVSGDERRTYAELLTRADRIAQNLRRCGAGSGDRVGLLLERSVDLPAGLLGILIAGAAYVPLDPSAPPPRLAHVAADAGFAAVVADTADAAAFAPGIPVVALDALDARGNGTLPAPPAPDDVAYVIYTSGSTGTPKGVQIEHRSLLNVLWAIRERPGITEDDRLLAVSTIAFDIASLEMLLPLMSGARVVIATAEEAMDGAALLALLRRHAITLMQGTPVTWQLLLEAGWAGDPRLTMLCGGEAMTRALADRLLANGELWNLYGPTETAIYSSGLRVEPGDGPVPLGPPLANTQLYVLDAQRGLVPHGAVGELWIGGDGVARGYVGLPDLETQRFIPDPFRDVPGARLYATGDLVRRIAGGRFAFLGRADDQVKLRGHRIELGEIEAALLKHAGVVAAAATIGTTAAGDDALWAYVVPRDPALDEPAWADALRAKLARVLPAYMVPAAIAVLPALPRTGNGKLDRRRLPRPVAVAPAATPAETLTPTEATIAQLVGDMLDRPVVRRHDDIFALGFHSLLAVRLVAQIRAACGVEIPLRALLQGPTIAELAVLVDSAAGAPLDLPADAVLTYHPDGSAPPLFFIHSDLFAEGAYVRRLAAALGPDQPIHSVPSHGTAGLPLLPTVPAMARDYVARIRAVQPHGPYRLGGFCVGGLVAYELARLLAAEGETVERLVLVNASAPPPRSILFGDWLLRAIGLNRRLDVRVRESLCYNIARFHAALARGPGATFSFLRERLGIGVERSANGAAFAEPQPFEKRKGTRETENSFAHLVAALSYHPEPYAGKLILVWSEAQRKKQGDPTMGWGTLAPHVTIKPISGGHIAPLNEQIADLGRALSEVLA